jgi:hypothetical protein
MSATDKFIEQNHHALFATISSFLPGRIRSRIRITENGAILGGYTVVLDPYSLSKYKRCPEYGLISVGRKSVFHPHPHYVSPVLLSLVESLISQRNQCCR